MNDNTESQWPASARDVVPGGDSLILGPVERKI